MTTQQNFVEAARSHRAAAELAAGAAVHAIRPFSHAYLRALAVECAAKACILKKMRATDVAELKRKNEKHWKALFKGSAGHDLVKLEQAADLKTKMRVAGVAFPSVPDWHRLAGNGGSPATERPYSLRYGSDAVTATEAAFQAAHLDSFVDVLLASAASKK